MLHEPCFVCHELTSHRSQCACRAFVHRHCLVKALAANPSTDCTICASPIENVYVCHEYQFQWTTLACARCGLCVVGSFAFAASASYLAIGISKRVELSAETHKQVVLLFAASFFLSVLGAAVCAFERELLARNPHSRFVRDFTSYELA